MTFHIKSLMQTVYYKTCKEAKFVEIGHPIAPQLMILPTVQKKVEFSKNLPFLINYLPTLSIVTPSLPVTEG